MLYMIAASLEMSDEPLLFIIVHLFVVIQIYNLFGGFLLFYYTITPNVG